MIEYLPNDDDGGDSTAEILCTTLQEICLFSPGLMLIFAMARDRQLNIQNFIIVSSWLMEDGLFYLNRSMVCESQLISPRSS